MCGHLDAHEGMGSGKDIFTNARMGTSIIVPYQLGVHCHPCHLTSLHESICKRPITVLWQLCFYIAVTLFINELCLSIVCFLLMDLGVWI